MSTDRAMPDCLTVGLEVIPENDLAADITDIDEVGHSLYVALKSDGCSINPVRTGRKGGHPAFDILLQLPQVATDHKDALLTLLNSLLLIIHRLLIARDRRAQRENGQRTPLKISVKIGDKSVVLQTADLTSATNLLEQLRSAGLFDDTAETAVITGEEEIFIRVRVPRKDRRMPLSNPDPNEKS